MTDQPAIDESLYSRQLYVLGKEAMEKMAHSNVLVVGLGGLGVEVAKNVALAGVKSITLWDPKPAQKADLASQYYLTEADLGQPRAAACHGRLAELNQYTPVSVSTAVDVREPVAQAQVVIVTDVDSIGGTLEALVALNAAARASGTKFIWAQTFGLAGAIFNDFGDAFTVIDPNGEEPVTGIVARIESDGEVIAPGSALHGLENDMLIELTKVSPPELNGQYRVRVRGPLTFELQSDKDFSTYVKGGEWKQVKEPLRLAFEPLGSCVGSPEFFVTDFAKFLRPAQLHIGFLALLAFKLKHSNELPRPQNEQDAVEVAELAKNVAVQLPDLVEEVDVDLIKVLARQSRGELGPTNTAIGGTAAQEVLKAVSGKFTPVKQLLYFDAFEAIPEGLTEADAQPRGSRYDPYYAVFGHALMTRLANLKVFLVGAGAIGCEVLKSWALLGVGSGPQGHITVTDNDQIERSNLNRQFLFRPKDVGRPKSETAAAAVAQMNPDYTAQSFTTLVDKVGPETQNVFNDEFWEQLDLVTNALDNVEARTYVDQRCVLYAKPLVESGTLGTKGNVQIVVPYLTESYSSSSDPPEKSIPMCTLRSFPAKIDHTIAWAKTQFEHLFSEAPNAVNAYLTQPNYVESTLKHAPDQKGAIEQITSYLVEDRPRTFDECIVWAIEQFYSFYNHDIRQLLYNFPPDATTSSGELFWEPPKRCPQPLDAVVTDADAVEFVKAAANLRAYNYGLKGSNDSALFEERIRGYKPKQWQPSSSLHIKVTDDEPDAGSALAADNDEIAKLASQLPPPSTLAGFRLNPVEFEKDDDSNFHIDFINAASNLRAENYGIEKVERSHTKFIAGKIIPAIATTTAVVTGLSTLEMIKVVEGKKLEEFKNGFISLALPFFGFSEPVASAKVVYNGDKSIDKIWGRFNFKNLPLQDFLKEFKEEYGLEISMMSCGRTLLYATFFPAAKIKERLPVKISDLVEQVSKTEIPKGETSLQLEIFADDESGEEIEDLPFINILI